MPNLENLKVVKKNGEVENFDEEKLKRSVFNAAKDAGYDENRALEISEEVLEFVLDSIENLETVDSESLRDLILNKLDADYPEISEKWREYERNKKEMI